MMNIHPADLTEVRLSLANKMLWGVFLVYLGVSGFAMAHHEVWGDEVHSWNIAKGSASFSDLITHTRYEGHPPGWYSILWVLSKFTHQVAYMQVVQWTIACSVVFMLLFFSPFPLSTKILLPFGYYFIYEYAVLSRNYGIGVLLVLIICFMIKKEFKYKVPLYYALLFCLSNVHLMAMLLAGSLHMYFLVSKREEKKKTGFLLLHILLGVLIFLPACYFIYPPSESTLNIHFWMSLWNIHQLSDLVNAPLRCLLPIPAWWKYNFWNTEFLLEARASHSIVKFINPLVTLLFLSGCFFLLRKNKKSQILFGTNLALSFALGIGFFSLSTARHAGFIYIGFIAAWWLYYYETPVPRKNQQFLHVLLSVQIIAGLFAVVQDIRYPFSNLFKIKEFVKRVPPNEKLVTDYWTMNAYVAFMDKPAYCLDMRRNISFVLWGPDLTYIERSPNRYSGGLKDLRQKEGITNVYMVSQASPELLYGKDSLLGKSYQVTLVDKIEGSMEKGSDLYLYKITSL